MGGRWHTNGVGETSRHWQKCPLIPDPTFPCGYPLGSWLSETENGFHGT